ncbi:hypothetical protein ARV1_gp40 [Acidianus rod-shaped virus 1]|uniref:Uncharacterized protein n=1 Tax=Acidianus rod-shaped virus 1 TaxID=309181 RepID=Q50I31_9VIRU|nr:hypothetical protein ARV1_gp02 [Acidianus rod-shaped virus 1]YP_001542657.1 hypothetical protein ARV1_gp40 [Acidianus rod-shaped virus 1]CAI44157.1 hypothetical protein [Acidianus rod-shaped virus 1]CAI44195.1 hypothetical protein [Acidianus rod-shaped virus 1]
MLINRGVNCIFPTRNISPLVNRDTTYLDGVYKYFCPLDFFSQQTQK